jgi:GntR family transcriptional regulator
VDNTLTLTVPVASRPTTQEDTVTRTAAGPIYARIEADLRRQIGDGTLALGSRLPAEQDLAQQYGVARMTVRQALGRLSAAGIVERRHGVGTFITSTKSERVTSRLLGFREDAIAHGLEPSTKILATGYEPLLASDALLLGAAEGVSALHVSRLRSTNGEPIGHNSVIIVPPYAAKLENIDWTASFYAGAAEEIGYEVSEVDQTIESVTAEPDVATMLGIETGAALLRVTRVTYLASRGRLGLTRSLYRGDRYFLSLRLHRGGVMPA